jgi:hypothetical protein
VTALSRTFAMLARMIGIVSVGAHFFHLLQCLELFWSQFVLYPEHKLKTSLFDAVFQVQDLA